MKKAIPPPHRFPAAAELQSLLNAAVDLHAATPGRRQRDLLNRLMDLFNAVAAGSRSEQSVAVVSCGARPAGVGRLPVELLRLARAQPRITTFTAENLDRAGDAIGISRLPLTRPSGCGDAIYSLAPPLDGQPESVLCIYFAHPLSRTTRRSASTALQLIHSITAFCVTRKIPPKPPAALKVDVHPAAPAHDRARRPRRNAVLKD